MWIDTGRGKSSGLLEEDRWPLILVPVEISRYSFRVFSFAYPTVISSISGKSFHFPFPYFVIFVLRYFLFHVLFNYLLMSDLFSCRQHAADVRKQIATSSYPRDLTKSGSSISGFSSLVSFARTFSSILQD